MVRGRGNGHLRHPTEPVQALAGRLPAERREPRRPLRSRWLPPAAVSDAVCAVRSRPPARPTPTFHRVRPRPERVDQVGRPLSAVPCRPESPQTHRAPQPAGGPRRRHLAHSRFRQIAHHAFSRPQAPPPNARPKTRPRHRPAGTRQTDPRHLRTLWLPEPETGRRDRRPPRKAEPRRRGDDHHAHSEIPTDKERKRTTRKTG